jgi:hypothetical protein
MLGFGRSALVARSLALMALSCGTLLMGVARGNAPAGVQCAIRAEPGKDFLRLEALVLSDTPVTGEYSLSILKQSSTGTSRNVQSGKFSLTFEGERVLTTIVLDGSAVGHYQAELSLESDRGSVSCNSP